MSPGSSPPTTPIRPIPPKPSNAWYSARPAIGALPWEEAPTSGTPSHNPPDNGGVKYNPPNGGPADTSVTCGIESRANALLEGALANRRKPFERAVSAAAPAGTAISTLTREMIDMTAICEFGIRLSVDPIGGAGVHNLEAIGERDGPRLSVISDEVGPAETSAVHAR